MKITRCDLTLGHALGMGRNHETRIIIDLTFSVLGFRTERPKPVIIYNNCTIIRS